MTEAVAKLEGSGLEVFDLQSYPGFTTRRVYQHDAIKQVQGMQRLTRAFVDHPEILLQELVNAAVELCNADSAGISLVKEQGSDEEFYEWVATAGMYASFQNAMLPRYPSACGVCLERREPQLFRVKQQFFDLMGVVAPVVTDGLLLPWFADGISGTIWIMAHDRKEAFDKEHCKLMQSLADFAAMAVRNQRQQKKLMEQAKMAAAAAVANDLAHQINNPLQSLTNVVYLAQQQRGSEVSELAKNLSMDLERLSGLVKEILALPMEANHPK